MIRGQKTMKCTACIFSNNQISCIHRKGYFRVCVVIKKFLFLLYIKNVETVKLSSGAIFESCGVRFHFAR